MKKYLNITHNFYKQRVKKYVPRLFYNILSPLFLYLHNINWEDRRTKKRYIFKIKKITRFPLKKIKTINFEQEEYPLVSVIIPVLNKWCFTYHCLDSLNKNTQGIAYEVIVVDNASSDETEEMMKFIKGVKYIKNTENKGFVEGCNIGASQAAGKYVIFLNNDTHILSGWLSALVETFEKNKNIGLVGSKLIYPNGQLQEAGGIVWKNKNAWNYGKFQSPGKYEFNYLKDVDYCSGASIMLPKKLFDKLGGFDELYVPAYYEDTDLAFRVRKAGFRTVYQPKSELVHFEGITAGRDVKKGLKQYQEINKEKFFKRWVHVLEKENFHDTEDGPFLARDKSMGKKVMLFMDHNVPTHDKDAGSFIAFEYLKLFSKQGYKIIFWPHNLGKIEPYTETLQQLGIEVIYGSRDASFDDFITKNGKYVDMAIISRPHVAEAYLKKIKTNSGAKIIYIPHDLHYLREARAAEIMTSSEQAIQAMETKKTELSIMEQSDVSLFFSDKEVEIVKKESSKINADVIPWIEILQDIDGKDFRKRKGLLFIGGFIHQPNEDAVLWFHEEVFPKLKNVIPDLQIEIIGNKPTEKIQNLNCEDFKVIGFVEDEDLPEYFNSARVFVAPLRFGAGFKGKIARSMSYGLPVVTTEIGAEGIGLIDRENAMITNDAQQFADKIIELYQGEQLWDKISKNSVMHLKDKYSVFAAEKKIDEIVKSLKI